MQNTHTIKTLLTAALVVAYAWAPVVDAQTQSDAANAAGTAAGVGGGQTAAGEVASIDVDAAFASGVNRDGTVGAAAATAPTFGGQDAAASARALGGPAGLGGAFGGLGNAFGGPFNPFFGGTAPTPSDIKILRTRLRSGVEIIRPNSTLRARQIENRLANLPVASRMIGVNLSIHDRTAILTGVVKTPKDKRLAKMLVALEPGVSKVDNQIVVQGDLEVFPPGNLPAPQRN